MTCERFSEGISLLHKMDPRAKIITAIIFSVAISISAHLIPQLIALCLSIILLLLSGLKIVDVIKRLFIVNIFVAFLWLTIPLGSYDLKASIQFLISITIKCNAILIANISLLSTSTVFSIAHALAHLRIPSKLVQIFFFSWRYLHVISLEYDRMKKALTARAFEPGTNLHTYRTYAYLLANLFIRSYDRGERIQKAMLCRGFAGTFWLLSHFTLRGRDIAIACIIIFGSFLVFLMDHFIVAWN